jgi:hypothetical protein
MQARRFKQRGLSKGIPANIAVTLDPQQPSMQKTNNAEN